MPQTDLRSLERLIAARHGCISILTFEEDHALDVIRHASLDGRPIWIWSNADGLREGLLAKSKTIPDTAHPAAALFRIWSDPAMRGLFVFLDLGGHLKDERTLRLLRELIQRCSRLDADPQQASAVILVDSSESLPPAIVGASARLELSYPGETELFDILRSTTRSAMQNSKVHVDLGKDCIDAMVKNLRGLTRQQARAAVMEAIANDRSLTDADVAAVMRFKRQQISKTGLLEFVEAPTSLDQIGGLGKLKAWLELRREALTDRARECGIEPPRGVLLLGVQGAGKSLAAKAVATAWQRPLLRMDVGAFYNRFVGETERNLRDAFRQAEMMSPVVLWIDEIEKAFASASSTSADGGLSKRMFGALLTWMQEHQSGVFLIATANDIESLPPELMRKGRFDDIFFVDLLGTDARRAIVEIHLRKRRLDIGLFDVDKLVAASAGYSGAEIEQAIISAMYEAFGANVILGTAHIERALRNSPPLSVTMAEKVTWLRQWAKDRCAPAE
jgi:hypothetical protein